MRVLITGGSGLIGRALAANLAATGYEVIILSRNPERATGLPGGVRAERWDGRTAQGWEQFINRDTAIVNLAGENIAGERFIPRRWTPERKQLIVQSRKDAGAAVVEAVKAATVKPRVVVQASAVGYYGSAGDAVLTESAPAGSDFSSRVTVDWEGSTEAVATWGVRRAVIRIGVVLSAAGGALTRLMLPFKLYVGGPMGSGRQWVSWIHLADAVAGIRFLIERESTSGVYNLTSPNPLTNADFGRTLARVMHRPYWMPVPGFALRLALGEVASVVLDGQRVVPQRLQQAGFTFRYGELEAALQDLLRRAEAA